ncbi:4-hydroxybutyrate CoA-transferase [candidate division WOR-3 bacterium]|uniref:4-hydroxybutyrate CoA-transferase n=1 Tax=candidate division WOR-3 bacterium TaxID=2052148 RepID=A0A660SCF6_UNCW3|nr:MAG: 4-hydroxybutyrate CoA-transferase [candidate division WOR-3 bacterium]
MRWIEEFRSKTITPEEAVSCIKSNDRVYISGNAATPYPLLEALARRKDELTDVELIHVLLLGDDPLSKPEMAGHFRHNSLFVGPADREAVNSGRADYIPIHLHRIPKLFREGILPIDVAIIHTSPPDEHGFLSLGVEVLTSKAAVESARIVIAQVNERMPRTLGDSFIHISKVTHIVRIDRELPELKTKPPTEVEERIGRYIAELVDDGATLQLGIGGIPDAVLMALKGKKDLGIHTEMVSDGVMDAIEAGIITGNRKSIHPGKVIATFIFGSKRLYDYVHDNPIFELHPTEYTNNPFIIAQNENMVAINSAIEVDLTGQVCSDSIGPYIYSGFGGQVDFIRGAAAAKGGKPIIALPSTAQKGRVSRIVPVLKVGAGVVTSRADVHYVVTEYGVAELFGKNLRERAQALINIAHPKFREDLIRGARERRLL